MARRQEGNIVVLEVANNGVAVAREVLGAKQRIVTNAVVARVRRNIGNENNSKWHKQATSKQ
jgi:hypothetical protein